MILKFKVELFLFHLFQKLFHMEHRKGVHHPDAGGAWLQGVHGGRRMREEKRILPCPFCPKGQARLQRRGHGYYVICKSCGCRTPLFQYQFDSREKLREQAIEAWNQRKPMDDNVKRRK